MSLPDIKVNQTIFTCTLPIDGSIVEFYPYNVQSEKGFLSAGKSEDMEAILQNYTAILKSVLITEIDIGKLYLLDFLYLSIIVRCKSKDEYFEGRYKICDNKECGKSFEFSMPIEDNLIFENINTHNGTIKISDNLSITLGPVKQSYLLAMSNIEDEVDLWVETIAHCTEGVIYNKIPYIDFTPEMVKEKVVSQFSTKHIKHAFDQADKLIKMHFNIDITCEYCGHIHQMREKNFLKLLN